MLYLDVACNDPDNGIFNHCAQSLQIGIAEFEADNWSSPPRFEETETGIRLSGKNWGTAGANDWVGNWCWNRYTLYTKEKTTRWYLVDFVKWLKRRGMFSCTTATTEFHHWFLDPHSALSDVQLHTLVCELEE